MAGTTFQEILSQFLEEKSPFSREERSQKPEFPSQFTSYEPSFTWETPTAPKKFGYKINTPPRPAPRESKIENGQSSEGKSSSDRAKIMPNPSEKVWNIENLSPEIQLQLEFLTRMGANFEGKISISLLKKAHRRLARQFHPDTNQSDGEDFLRLQSIYEELSENLNSLEKTKVAA
jgi:hypothetical protein